ncbi:M1 family metallopeptidase [Paenibacillus naphthalenovorans]|uniref:EnpEP protein n=1 Tax=Paenibacillus naphthalenovorans TaxID=162209 RepID=A0A0U2VN69_9BACL|nr:M1 family metallopeptidase [Paenibacillus naphthalenovorans]ALS24739.1 EnpEP protein [Paenibacillus naphthalenovorans]
MKKRIGSPIVSWGLLTIFACGVTLLTNALLSSDFRSGTPSAGWKLSAEAAYPAVFPAEGGVDPLNLKPIRSTAGHSIVEAPAWPQARGQADGSSTGIFLPTAHAEPVSGRVNEPAAPPPAPPSLPVKPVEKPAPKPLSNRIVEYHLNVELDADGKLIKGTSSMTWKNPGSRPVQELYFHLYPNAFESKKTTFMKESGGKLRDDVRKEDSFGSMTVSSIRTLDGAEMELIDRMEYVQPDDGNKDDNTLIRVPLPKPVMPGGSVDLLTQFSVKLPQVFARMGYANDFVMAGQWFPKIAVYEPKGTRGRTDEGWNLHQYHGNSEFYADFGIFDVRIKVPSAYKVAATGFPTKPVSDDGKTKTYSFYSDDVHDFAWAASPHFIYHEEPYATPHLPGVRIKLYLDPKHEHLKARYMTAAKKALARYSQWYGSYPYNTLSIVVPPEEGNGAGGMEYPTLITAWGAAEENPSLELERVVVHEIGHQFFYGMVASNEFEEAWLDEGFTSYVEDKLMEAEYGVRPNLLVESSYITNPAALLKNAWSYDGHHHYAENVYTRAKLVLKAMERQVGAETMDKIMRTYFQRWKFKHPTTSDFQQVVEDVTKTSWQPFFDQYVYNGMMVDYAVTGIKVQQVTENGQTYYENSVQLRKLGGTYQNVPVRFQFADGTQLDKTWNGADSEVIMKLNHTAPLSWAAIDPEHSIVLENKRINGFMKTEVDKKLSVRWNVSVVKILETLFGWVAW